MQPKPSFVALLRDADLFITTGLDLELWVPTLLDRANEPEDHGGWARVRGGLHRDHPARGAHLAEPRRGRHPRRGQSAHPSDPINGIIIGRNILTGLVRVDPANGDYYKAREQDFEKRVLEATMGKDLVTVLTPAVAFNLLKTNQFDGFVAKTMLKGKPLSDQLGGWLKTGEAFKGKEMACYHKEWAYFSARFQVTCVTYIEAKPGIPPTPGHVEDVIALMKSGRYPCCSPPTISRARRSSRWRPRPVPRP